MSDLDKKLEEAVRSTVWISKIDDQVRDKVHPDWFNANGQYFTFGIDTAAVKQAFIDDGWSDKPWTAVTKDGYSQIDEQHDVIKQLMTGQEWYDRFEKEYTTPYVVIGKDGVEGEIRVNPLEAAKKAAGIEE